MILYKLILPVQYIVGDNMYISIILRTLFMYFFIILVYRIMGKKEVGELSIIDLIVSILIAELVAIAIEAEKSILLKTVNLILQRCPI